MEGPSPKVPSEARSADGWGLGPQCGIAPIKFSKINVDIAYFSPFLQDEMVSSAVAARQNGPIKRHLP